MPHQPRPGRWLRPLPATSPHFSLVGGEDDQELIEHQLHYLALEDHVDGHVGWLGLGAEQRGAKHDGEALDRHPVRIPVLSDPGDQIKKLDLAMCVCVCVCVFSARKFQLGAGPVWGSMLTGGGV